MDTIKSIGSTLLGVVIFFGSIIAAILLFTLGAKLAFTIQPFVNWLAGILLVINLLLLLAAIIPKARGIVGLIIFISSFVYGLGTWIFGLAVTLALWGWLAVIIGVLLGGVGVVPIGMLSAIFHGEWGLLWTLIINIVLTYGTRVIGRTLVDSTENQSGDDEIDDKIIDVEPVAPHKRAWKDIE